MSGALRFMENLLGAGVARGTPLLMATLGELLAERAGVLNLGVDGMMLLGAAAGFRAAYQADSLILGLATAMGVGALLALLHGLVTVRMVADQVVSGLGLGFFGTGLSSVVGAPVVGAVGAPRLPTVRVAGLSAMPLFGPVLFQQNLAIYLGMVLIPLTWFYLHRTRWGLLLQAVGESPEAADAHGFSVARVRLAHVAAGGALAGMAGATLSLAITPGWVDGLTSGQGWIAVGLVIFAGWEPTRAAWGAYLFGAIRRLPLDLQGVESLPLFRNPNLGYFLDMAPYIFTILVLILASRGKWARRAPAALGLPFIRGERN